jgi:hypothetical protein
VGSEAFAHHLLALGPERLGVLRIEGVGSDPGTHRADQPFGDPRHLAILAISAAELLGRGDEGGPDRSRRALRNRFPLKGRPSVGCQLGIDLRDDLVELVRRHMAAKLGLDPTWVQRDRPHPARLVSPVELHREQDVGGLGPAIGDHRVVGRALEIGIVEVDVRIAVAGGGDVHQPSARRDQRRDAVRQNEMAEMVGPELRFEAIGGVPEGRPHRTGIGDHGSQSSPRLNFAE